MRVAEWGLLILLPVALGGSEATVDRLAALNDRFHQQYAQTKAEAFSLRGNSLVVLNDSIATLYTRAGQWEAPFQPLLFNELKSICHLPLTLHMLLSRSVGKAEWQGHEQLAEIAGLVQSISADNVGASTFTVPAERRILSESTALIAGLGPVPPQDLAERLARFLGGMRAQLESLVTVATRASLSSLHRVLSDLLIHAPPGDTVYAVVTGEHIPEKANAYVAYLSAALGTRREGDRVYYSTHAYSLPEVLGLVKGHLADAALGRAAFGDSNRLHADLLGPAAAAFVVEQRAFLPFRYPTVP
jgi:hypothetical protein